MNGSSADNRGDAADRQMGEWSDLSAMSRPPAAGPEVLRARVEVGVMKRPGSRRSVPGLVAVMVVVMVVAAVGLGFGLSSQRFAAVPSASASAATSESAVVSPAGPPTDWWFSPSPTAVVSPSAVAGPFASSASPATALGDTVADLGRIDEKNGWVYVRDTGLMITEDGGATWRNATPPVIETEPPMIDFVDASHGWLLDEDSLWRTADGGRSWHETALPADTSAEAVVSFVSASTGYLLLSANIDKALPTWNLYRTDDGGASLKSVGAVALPGEPGNSGPLPAIAFSDRLDGVIAGWSAVLQTHDGGQHWSTVSLPASQGTGTARYSGVYQLRAFGPRVVLVAWMENATLEATTYSSDDAGRTWRPAYTWSPESMDAWAIVNGQTWLGFTTATGPVQVKTTADSGATWKTATGASPTGNPVLAVSFVSPTDGWAIFQIPGASCAAGAICEGSPLEFSEGQLAETHDGGVNWQLVP
jgi:hypothetical protein